MIGDEQEAVGRTVTSARLDEDEGELLLVFSDGWGLSIALVDGEEGFAPPPHLVAQMYSPVVLALTANATALLASNPAPSTGRPLFTVSRGDLLEAGGGGDITVGKFGGTYSITREAWTWRSWARFMALHPWQGIRLAWDFRRSRERWEEYLRCDSCGSTLGTVHTPADEPCAMCGGTMSVVRERVGS